MKLYAPKYYKNFVCIADKCEHSCCVGWEIDIDKKTLERYSSLSCDYGKIINNSISIEDTPHFILAKNSRCPHLDENGLCNIIINIGEENLCDICREHPRFYNFTDHGKEVGLGMSCEEACRVILCSDDYDIMIDLGEIEEEIEQVGFDPIEYRNVIYKILKDTSLSFESKLAMICDYYDIFLDTEQIRVLLFSLEYLDDAHRELFQNFVTCKQVPSIEQQLTRILAYFVFRHCSECCDDDEFFASLSFAFVCTELIASISDVSNIEEMARIVSEEIEYSGENTEKIKSLFC